MATIAIKGGVAQCDSTDLPLLSQYRWRTSRKRYRTYAVARINGKSVYMHQLILPNAKEIDHKNRDGLDNRRENLRECTRSQNIANAEYAPSSCGYRGVHMLSGNRTKPYRAGIRVNQQRIYLGCYKTSEEAAIAYDKAARRYFGEFAFQNFPLDKDGIMIG